MPKTSNGFLLAAEKKNPDVADDPRRFRSGSDSIIGHRRDPMVDTLFEMQIRWGDDKETWVPESSIQKDANKTLFAYWGSAIRERLATTSNLRLFGWDRNFPRGSWRV
ncbi:hypothetical protein LZ30DRAFT_737993 [Colletotrichum cereale]|nr:hypothetical protein LZ30DRAFT_737993 [Colletotrichum cereale]